MPSLITDFKPVFIGGIFQSSAHQTISILNTGIYVGQEYIGIVAKNAHKAAGVV